MANHSSQGHKHHFLDPSWHPPFGQRCFQHCFTALDGNGDKEGVIEHHSSINWTSEAGKTPYHLHFFLQDHLQTPSSSPNTHNTQESSSVFCWKRLLGNAIEDVQIITRLVSQLPNKHTDSTLCLGKHPGIRINNTVKLEWNSSIYSH